MLMRHALRPSFLPVTTTGLSVESGNESEFTLMPQPVFYRKDKVRSVSKNYKLVYSDNKCCGIQNLSSPFWAPSIRFPTTDGLNREC